MLSRLLTEDCVVYILSKCDIVCIEVLRHVPELIPSHLLECYEEYTSVSVYAAGGGYFNLLRWAVSTGYYVNSWSCECAAGSGHLEILKWLSVQLPDEREEGVCSAAARGGHLEVLIWAYTNGYSGDEVYKEAASSGHLDVLKWAKENECDNSGVMMDLCTGAASNGHLEVLKWMNENGWCIVNSFTLTAAGRSGQLEVLKWCLAEGVQEYVDVGDLCDNAASGGHLDTLKWLRANGYRWCSTTCSYAAANGHLEVLKWLRAQQPACEWDHTVCTYAAGNGNLDVLVWARENGCEWNSRTLTEAVRKGRLEIVKWLLSNGCVYQEVVDNICELAITGDHLELLVWALSVGLKISPGACEWARKNGCSQVAEWMYVNGLG